VTDPHSQLEHEVMQNVTREVQRLHPKQGIPFVFNLLVWCAQGTGLSRKATLGILKKVWDASAAMRAKARPPPGAPS
jgi:hypothetical protein